MQGLGCVVIKRNLFDGDAVKTRAMITFCALAVLTPAVLRSQQGRTPEQLAAAYIDAMRTNDDAAIERLLHPAMKKCPTLSDPTYIAGLRRTRDYSRPKIKGPYHVHLFAVSDSMSSSTAYETVRPTKQLDISFDGTPLSVIRRIAQSGNDWFIVMPCFTTVGLSAMRR
jgi:hypothetical protein